MPRGGWFDFYWSRIARWCLLGAFVMLVWSLAPVVRCSWTAFRDTPIGEVDTGADPSQADSGRVAKGQGFWNGFTWSVKQCYRRTPLFGQEPWKHQLLVGFAVGTVLAWIAADLASRRRKTFTS